jgi:hypothetical protein
MTTTIITTFSDKNYNEYAKFFMSSLEKYLDKNVNVLIYTDTPLFDDQENWKNLILSEECPNLLNFKNRNGYKKVEEGTKGFLFDAVRFSHKSYCIIDASRKIKNGNMIWLDADTEVLDYLSEEYLNSHLDDDKFVSFLGRPDRYTETGWLSFNLDHPATVEFFNLWEWYYNTDEIYNLSAQLDCHVFDACREKLEKEGKIQTQNISPPNIGKAHFDVRFKNFMCHYKGERKHNRDVYFAKATKNNRK